MSLVKKLKDILFEEEEDYTTPIKIQEEVKKEDPKIVKIESPKEEVVKEEVKKEDSEFTPTREALRVDNSFKFPDFDEEEFVSNVSKPKANANVLEYERKKMVEKRKDYGRYERVETREYIEKRKFKPSPIISPVYGILNQDYKAEDIIDRTDYASTISIEEVRKKAFEPKKEEVKETIDEPVVTFFEERDTASNSKPESNENYKTIDDLLEEASTEISLEDTIEIPKTNNIDEIEDELEKLDVEEKDDKNLDDTLDSDLFELIDSMYEERGEE